MATTDQALDVQYQILQWEEQEQLEQIFSPYLIGLMRRRGVTTYANRTNVTHVSVQPAIEGELRGLSHLTGAISILTHGSKFEDDIFEVGAFQQVKYLQVSLSNLISVGNVNNLTNLLELKLNDNKLTSLGDLSSLVLLQKVHLHNNLFTSAIVSALLYTLGLSNGTGYKTLTEVNLSGNAAPSLGVNDPNYQSLVNDGVIVTITTA